MELTTFEWVDIWLVHLMVLGQTVFLIIWGLLPWWKEWIGRALMIKSVALWLLLVVGIVNFWFFYTGGGYGYAEQVTFATHVLIMVGIWSQVIALAYEMRKADKHDRKVVGTENGRGSA